MTRCLSEPPRSLTPRDKNGCAFLPPRAVQRKCRLIDPLGASFAKRLEEPREVVGPIKAVIGSVTFC